MPKGSYNTEGLRIKIIDLPGIYSFSTYSLEEVVSRDFIALEKPDVVVNVIDASALERNLFFTLQLIELERADGHRPQPGRPDGEKGPVGRR